MARRAGHGPGVSTLIAASLTEAPLLASSAIALLGVTTLLTVAQTLLVGDLFYYLVAQSGESATQSELTVTVILLALVYLLNVGSALVRTCASELLAVRLDSRLQSDLMKLALSPSTLEQIDDPTNANAFSAAQAAISGVTVGRAAASLVSVAAALATGLAGCAAVAWRSPLAGTLALVFLLAVAGRTMRLHIRNLNVSEIASGAFRRAGYLSNILLSPAGGRESRLYGFGDWAVSAYEAARRDSLAPIWLRRDVDRATAMRSAVLVVLGMGIPGSVVVMQGLHGLLSIRDVVICIVGLIFAQALSSVSPDVVTVSLGLSALRSKYELTEALGPPAIPAARLQSKAVRDLRVSHISFTYPQNDLPTLRDVDLCLPYGRKLAVVGPNGAGKSTLIKIISGLYAYGEGVVVTSPLSGAASSQTLQRSVAAVLQDFTRFPFSVSENVAGGSTKYDEILVDQALTMTGSHEFVAQLPAGANTVISSLHGGVDLSGGQWQRIAIARAVYKCLRGAAILILDEPTSHLDVYGEGHIIDCLTRELSSSIVLVTHRLVNVRQMDEITVLQAGSISGRGTHDQLMRVPGWYRDSYLMQAERFSG